MAVLSVPRPSASNRSQIKQRKVNTITESSGFFKEGLRLSTKYDIMKWLWGQEPNLAEKAAMLALDTSQFIKECFAALIDKVYSLYENVKDKITRYVYTIVTMATKLFNYAKNKIYSVCQFLTALCTMSPEHAPPPKVSEDMEEMLKNRKQRKKMHKQIGEEDTLFSGFFAYIISILATFTSFCTNFSVGIVDCGAAFYKCTMVLSALNVWERCDVATRTKRLVNWLVSWITDEPMFEDVHNKNQFMEYHAKLGALMESADKVKNPTTHMIMKITKTHRKFKNCYYRVLVDFPKEAAWARTLFTSIDTAAKLFAGSLMSQTRRYAPVGIWLAGAAGTGKTATQKQLIKDIDNVLSGMLADSQDTLSKAILADHASRPSVFTRNCMEAAPEFDDGYNNARHACFEEAQTPEDQNTNLIWMKKIFAWLDTQPLACNMAFAKGERYVDSPFVYITGNTSKGKLVIQTGMKDPQAFYRRMDFIFIVTHPEREEFDLDNVRYTLHHECKNILKNKRLRQHSAYDLYNAAYPDKQITLDSVLEYEQVLMLMVFAYAERISPEYQARGSPSRDLLKKHDLSKAKLAALASRMSDALIKGEPKVERNFAPSDEAFYSGTGSSSSADSSTEEIPLNFKKRDDYEVHLEDEAIPGLEKQGRNGQTHWIEPILRCLMFDFPLASCSVAEIMTTTKEIVNRMAAAGMKSDGKFHSLSDQNVYSHYAEVTRRIIWITQKYSMEFQTMPMHLYVKVYLSTLAFIYKQCCAIFQSASVNSKKLLFHEKAKYGPLFAREAYLLMPSWQRDRLRDKWENMGPLGPGVERERTRIEFIKRHTAWLARRRIANKKRQAKQTARKNARRAEERRARAAALSAASREERRRHQMAPITGPSWADMDDEIEYDSEWTMEDMAEYNEMFYRDEENFEKQVWVPNPEESLEDDFYESPAMYDDKTEVGFFNKYYWRPITNYEGYQDDCSSSDVAIRRRGFLSLLSKFTGGRPVHKKFLERFDEWGPLLTHYLNGAKETRTAVLARVLHHMYSTERPLSLPWIEYFINVIFFGQKPQIPLQSPCNLVSNSLLIVRRFAPCRQDFYEALYAEVSSHLLPEFEPIDMDTMLKTSVVVLGIISVVALVCSYFGKDDSEEKLIMDTIAVQDENVKRQIYEMLAESYDPRKAPQNVETKAHAAVKGFNKQGFSDDRTIGRFIQNSYAVISTDERHILSSGTFLFGNVFMLNHHVWESLPSVLNLMPFTKGTCRRCISLDKTKKHTYNVLLNDYDSDTTLVQIKCAQPHHNLIKHIIPQAHLCKPISAARILSFDKTEGVPFVDPLDDCARRTKPVVYDEKDNSVIQHSLAYRWKGTGPGACGSMVFGMVSNQLVFLGFHIAGNSNHVGIASTLYREQFDWAQDPTSPQYVLMAETGGQVSFSDVDFFSKQCYEMRDSTIYVAQTIPMAKNNLEATPFTTHKFRGGPTTAPAKTTKAGYINGMDKEYQINADTMNPDPIVYELVEEYKWDIVDLIAPPDVVTLGGCVMLSYEEAVIEHHELDRFDFHTSEGLRLKALGIKKVDLQDANCPSHDVVRNEINSWHTRAKEEGEFTYQLNVDACKVEPRPIEKVLFPRTYNITDFFDNILLKQGMGDLVARLKVFFMFTVAMCGINPAGSTWSIIYKRFLGRRVCASDIKGWDYTMKRWLCAVVFGLFRRAYADPYDYSFACWCFLSCLYGVRCAFGIGRIPGGGNTSGNWCTTFFNTICNLIYHAVVCIYGALEQGLDPRVMLKKLRLILYSDDNISSLHGQLWWNSQFLARTFKSLFGVTLTAPDKGDIADMQPTYAIHEVEFLCRRFVKRHGVVFAPLALDSLFQQLYWVRMPDGQHGKRVMYAQLQINLDNVMRELCEYEPKEAQELLLEISQFIAAHRLPLVLKPFPYYKGNELKLSYY